MEGMQLLPCLIRRHRCSRADRSNSTVQSVAPPYLGFPLELPATKTEKNAVASKPLK